MTAEMTVEGKAALKAIDNLAGVSLRSLGFHEITTMYPPQTELPAGVVYDDIVIDTEHIGEYQITSLDEANADRLLSLWNEADRLWLCVAKGDNGKGFDAKITNLNGGEVHCTVFAIDSNYRADLEASGDVEKMPCLLPRPTLKYRKEWTFETTADVFFTDGTSTVADVQTNEQGQLNWIKINGKTHLSLTEAFRDHDIQSVHYSNPAMLERAE